MEKKSKSNLIPCSLYCSQYRPLQFICVTKHCKQQPFICGNSACKCSARHSCCTITKKNAFLKHFQDFNQLDEPTQSAYKKVLSIYNKMIQTIIVAKNQIQQEIYSHTLGSDGQLFLNYLGKGQVQKITSQLTFNIHNKQRTDKCQSFLPKSKQFIQKWESEYKDLLDKMIKIPKATKERLFLNSGIITEQNQIKIKQIFKKEKITKVRQFFNSTKDLCQDLVKSCGKEEDTFMVLQVAKVKFGVYIPLNWESYESRRKGSLNSFIFSLNSQQGFEKVIQLQTIKHLSRQLHCLKFELSLANQQVFKITIQKKSVLQCYSLKRQLPSNSYDPYMLNSLIKTLFCETYYTGPKCLQKIEIYQLQFEV